jgi:pimeloyl-ACP methyl ester carboxylesterase
MRRLALLAACAVLALTGSAAADPASPAALEAYAKPHRLVDIEDGRRLNLFCMGEQGPTVLFDAGGSDWSVVWALVQPALAGQARACAYDRAGLGYSDPARGPRTPAAIADDLHALIKAAGLGKPIILVGHSLGGFNVKLHAALYPEDVAGLVLVDPSEERDWDRTRELMRARYGEALAARAELADKGFLGFLADRYRECAQAAKAGDLDPASITYRRCSDPPRPQLGPAIAAERQRLQVKPAYQAAQASEILSGIYGANTSDTVYARLFRPGVFGDLPMVVLTHGKAEAGDELDALGDAQWLELHRQTARLSRRGVQRTVPGTGHHIELEAPQAIVEAVREVIAQSRTRR